MMPDTKYNGWTNYETWAVKLWLDNDQGSCEYWADAAQELYDKSNAGGTVKSFTREENAAYDLSERLKEEIGEPDSDVVKLPDNGLYLDLLNAALSEVNWHEIADAYITEVEKETVDAEG